ncbi:MAG: cupin domain-containing protein [Magnetococcales bacterium]|nr:cupin domain-containing protein [Magnetococcales bacterium]
MPSKVRIERFEITEKPWGREILIARNDHYAFKRIQMVQGTRSSFQYHRRKLESLFIVSGRIELVTEFPDGQRVTERYGPGEGYTVPPGVKHRVTVLEQCDLFEVSTPQLEDVVRVADDYGREQS